MGEDGGAGLTWEKWLTLIFIIISFVVLFVLLTLALFMPSLRS